MVINGAVHTWLHKGRGKQLGGRKQQGRFYELVFGGAGDGEVGVVKGL